MKNQSPGRLNKLYLSPSQLSFSLWNLSRQIWEWLVSLCSHNALFSKIWFYMEAWNYDWMILRTFLALRSMILWDKGQANTNLIRGSGMGRIYLFSRIKIQSWLTCTGVLESDRLDLSVLSLISLSPCWEVTVKSFGQPGLYLGH